MWSSIDFIFWGCHGRRVRVLFYFIQMWDHPLLLLIPKQYISKSDLCVTPNSSVDYLIVFLAIEFLHWLVLKCYIHQQFHAIIERSITLPMRDKSAWNLKQNCLDSF